MLIALFILLQISFSLHIYSLVLYVLRRENKYLKGFINTTISNVLLAGAITTLAIIHPVYVAKVDFKLLLWLMTGFIMLIMLFIKISIARAIYKRSKDPQHFHYNYFGKKVLHGTVVKFEEILIFFFTMPFFLFCGAYFIARLINLLLYKQL
ncbi:MAG TPA: hypothetical protein PL059_02500 [Spirochaetota bacterium]|nr:hypothetical protein [Spirochaetota bacterium]HOM08778.1 hypothetical protein [Spirochaetota bacterium]HPP51134.1 hypothetical protein [Spirochaetota bacterium]